MSLRTKLMLYLVGVHGLAALAVFGAPAGFGWIIALEAVFVLSLALGIRLVRHILVPLELIHTGAELMEEGDFTVKFVESGQPEMDRLVRIYNTMVERLRQERVRFEEQHYFMDKILAASPAGVATFDVNGQIATVNPGAERLLDLHRDEVIGKPLEQVDSGLAQTLAAIEPGASRVVFLQGRRRVKCHKAEFLDRGFRRVFLMMEELTEELRLSSRAAYEKVIRLLAHEIHNSVGAVNSLLASCLTYSDQLAPVDRQDYCTALQVARDRMDHLNGFMRGYAELVRLPEPRLAPVDVEALLRDIEILMGPQSRQRGIRWVWDVQQPLPLVALDKNMMEQVLMNILKNGFEAVGRDGQVTVRLGCTAAGRSYIEIEDTGTGISPQVREQLFTPFFSTKENGQGLGLTLVQEVLVRHGFEFGLESAAGGSTRFRIAF